MFVAPSGALIATANIGKPILITSVDAEESFDWSHPFSSTSINVSAMSHQHRAHDIFARHGVVPVYLVDYSVAHQDDGRAPLRELLANGTCEVGAQLHPWVNPPFIEPLSIHNSYPGNLPPALEREKLHVLTEELKSAFGIVPQIYRAGRYGIGPHTAQFLKELGYKADTSVMPHWNFGADGGPDFRGMTSSPFWIDAEHDLLEIPISAAVVGRAARSNESGRYLFNNTAERFRLPAVMARLGLVERIKLTPEGVTIHEAKRLVRHMVALGHKVFVLTFHSPSLEAGNTPYVRTEEDLRRLLDWLDEFFCFFKTDIGGRPISWREAYALLSENALASPKTVAVTDAWTPSGNLSAGTTPGAAQVADCVPSPMVRSKPTVLTLAFYYPPENAIGAARPQRMARYLEHSGYPVTVIASNPSELAHLPSNAVRVPRLGEKRYAVTLASNMAWAIERFMWPYADRLQWTPHAYAAAATTLRTNPNQVVLSTHPPVATHLAALALKWRYGVRWIADFRDPLSDNPFRSSRRTAILDPLLERAIFRNADAVIANTATVAELWKRRYPKWADKIHLIWNGFDPADEIAPLPLSGRKRRSIVHVGTLYGPRTPRPLVESLNRLFDSKAVSPEEIELRLVGPVEKDVLDLKHDSIAQFAARGCLHIEAEMVPKARAEREVLEADYLLLLDMTRGLNAGIQLPAKIFDYIRACRPILAFASAGSSTEHVLERSGVRYVCIDPAATGTEIDSQVTSFLAAPLTDIRPSPGFWQDFDARNQIVDLIRIISSIHDDPGL